MKERDAIREIVTGETEKVKEKEKEKKERRKEGEGEKRKEEKERTVPTLNRYGHFPPFWLGVGLALGSEVAY